MKKTASFLKWLIMIPMTYGSVSGSESDGSLNQETTVLASSGLAQTQLPVITADHSSKEYEAGEVTVTTLRGAFPTLSVLAYTLLCFFILSYPIHYTGIGSLFKTDSDNEWNHLEGNLINLVWYQTREAGNNSAGSVMVLNAVRQEIIASKHIFKRKLIESAAFQYFIESIDPTNASATSTNLNFGKFELLAAYTSSYGYGLDDTNTNWPNVSSGFGSHEYIHSSAVERMELLYENASAAADELSTNWKQFEQGLDGTFNMTTQLEKLVTMLVVPAYNRAVDAFMDLLDTLKKDPATLRFLFEQYHTAYAPVTGSPDRTNSPVTGSPDQTNIPVTGSPDQTNIQVTGSPDQTNSPVIGSPDHPNSPVIGSPDLSNSPVTGSPDKFSAAMTVSPNQTKMPMTGSPDQTNSPTTGSPDQTDAPIAELLMERILLDFQFQLVSSIAQQMDINLKQSDQAAKTLKKMFDLKTEVLEVENIQIQKQMEQNAIEAAKLQSRQKALTDSKPLAQENLETAQKNYNAHLNHKAHLEKKKKDYKCIWYKPWTCIKNFFAKINGDLRDVKRQLAEINNQLTWHHQHLAQLQTKINNLNSQLKNNADKSAQLALKDQLLINNMAKLSESSVKIGLLQKDMAAALIKIGTLLSGTATFDNADNLNEALIPIRHVAEKLNDEVKSHVLLVLPQLSLEDKQLIEDNLNKWKTYDHHYTYDIDYYKGAKSVASFMSLTLPYYTVLTILCTHFFQMLWK